MKTNPGVNWLQNCGEKRYSGEKLRRQQGSLGLLCTVHSAVLSLLTLLSSFKLIQVHLSLIKLKLCCELQLHMSFSALVSQTHTHTLLKVLHWIGAFFNLVFFAFLHYSIFSVESNWCSSARLRNAATPASPGWKTHPQSASPLPSLIHHPHPHPHCCRCRCRQVTKEYDLDYLHRDARPRKASPAPPAEIYKTREFLSFPRWKMLRPAHPWLKQLF